VLTEDILGKRMHPIHFLNTQLVCISFLQNYLMVTV